MAETKESSDVGILAPWRADLIELWGEKYVSQMQGDWLDPRKLDRETVDDIRKYAEQSRAYEETKAALLADLTSSSRQAGVAGASAAHRSPATHQRPQTFDQFATLAHAYGEGPVTVSPKYEKNLAHPKRDLAALAKAVAAWNKATGIAMFRLVDDQEADIVVSITAAGGDQAGAPGAAATGSPPGYNEGQTQGQINVYGENTDPAVYKHELGHTLGLAHSGVGTDTYASTTSVMGSANNPSAAEGAVVAANLGSSTRTLSPSHVAPTPSVPQRVSREAKKNRKRAKDPTPGNAPGR